MPTSFNPAVSAPGGMSYAAPLMDFMDIANLPNKYYEGVGNRQRQGLNDQAAQMNAQQQQLNTQRIQQGQMAVDASRAVAGGDFRTKDGGIDYGKLVQTMLKYGDVNGLQQLAPLMMQQQAAAMGNDPLLQPAGGALQRAPTSQPQVAVPANSPKGDAGTGTVTSLVTDRLPNQDTTTGQTIARIAQVLGVDPNANLTPGQITRAQGLLKQYAPTSAGGGEGGNLPPSASAGTPAPPSAAAAQPQQGAPNGAPSQQPLTPQEPLPQGFTDPQQAAQALRARAAQIAAANPKAKPIADQMIAKAERIEASIQPVDVNPNTTRLDPRTGQKLYQGPAAAAIEASAHAGGSPTLDADAERYLQSGQLPPNLSKNLMGQAEAKAIRDRATAMAQERNINTAELPQKWQQFKAQQVGIQRFTSGPQGNTIRSFNVLVDHLDTLSEAATALGNKDNRLYNRFVQNWSAATGNPAPTNFDGVKALVGDEIVKAVVGSAGALADREEVKKDLDRASSPKQLEELVGKYKKLALGQLHGLQKQYETATGLKNFDNMLLPGTLKALGGVKEGDGKAKPDKDGWITLSNGARIQEVK